MIREYKGILLASVLGTIINFVAPYIPSVNSILLGFIVGILVGNLLSIPDSFQSGIAFTGSKLLELSIIFLAFSINFNHIAAIGWQTFLLITIVVIVALLLTIYLSKKFKCPGSSGLLIGFGTVICGSSAIAALAPTVSKDREEIGISMAVVNLLGSVGMVLMPLVLTELTLTHIKTGVLLGGSLHSVANVAGAAYPIGNDVGQAAITIKLARVALLSPALIFFNYLINKNNVDKWTEHFKLPWYLWIFIGITILTSFIPVPKEFSDLMETIGKIVLVVSMTAIGLNVSFKHLFQSGKKGLVFGLIMFAVQIILVVLFLIYP